MGEIIVVGGGVVGAAAAYHLARAGQAVTLIDRADDGQATAAGAGIISPGTGFPPGAMLSLAMAATDFYQTLLAQLAEDGEEDTGYATCGGLLVATTEVEAAQLPERYRMLTARRAQGLKSVGDVTLLEGYE